VAAVLGFTGAAILYAYLISLSAEAREMDPFLCPAVAVVMAVIVFVLVFRKIITYDYPPSGSSGK
jgi:hypothetical protein